MSSPVKTSRENPARRHGLTGVLLAAGMLGLWGVTRTFTPHGSLFDDSLLTGWILIVLLAALCACLWSPRRGLPALGVQLRWVAVLTGFASMVFAVHIQDIPPTGLLDQLLAWVFVALFLSSAWGYRLSILLEREATEGRRKRFHTWLYLQALALGVLLGGGAIHGVLMHTHGMMAKALELWP